LIAGRTYAARRLEVAEVKSKFSEQYAEVLRSIESALVETRRNRFRDLSDSEVKEALELLIKTVETLDKGIIYEFKATDPRIQMVIDSVHEAVNRHTEGKNQPKIDRKEAIACLRSILATVKLHRKRSTSKTAYLDFTSQFV
jgi:hypothetical protein